MPEAEGKDREVIQHAPPPDRRALVNVGDEQAEDRTQRRRAKRQFETILNAAPRDLVTEERGLEVRQREVRGRQRVCPDLAEGGGDEDGERCEGTEEDDQEAKGEERPLPSAKVDALRTYAAPADRDVRTAFQIFPLGGEADHREQDEQERERGCIREVRRITAEDAVDAGRQEGDLRRGAEEGLRPEKGQ